MTELKRLNTQEVNKRYGVAILAVEADIAAPGRFDQRSRAILHSRMKFLFGIYDLLLQESNIRGVGGAFSLEDSPASSPKRKTKKR